MGRRGDLGVGGVRATFTPGIGEEEKTVRPAALEASESPLRFFDQDHPPAEQLERFMRSELSLPERLPIVRHMLSGCSECLKATRPLWEVMEQKLERRGAHR